MIDRRSEVVKSSKNSLRSSEKIDERNVATLLRFERRAPRDGEKRAQTRQSRVRAHRTHAARLQQGRDCELRSVKVVRTPAESVHPFAASLSLALGPHRAPGRCPERVHQGEGAYPASGGGGRASDPN